MTDLMKYDAACRALAVARTTDDVHKIRDHAGMMRAYARQAKNRQLELDAAEIRIRAERRLGELIAEQKRTVGLRAGNRGKAGPGRGKKNGVVTHDPVLPTLKEAGIDKDLSSRSQKLARLPERVFEKAVTEWRAAAEPKAARVSTKLLRRPKPSTRIAKIVEPDTSPRVGARSPGTEMTFAIARVLVGFADLDSVEQQIVITVLDQKLSKLRMTYASMNEVADEHHTQAAFP